MGILKRLFGGKQAPAPEPGLIPYPLVERTAADIPEHPFEAGRPQAPDGPVDWPIDPATGIVFDDEWLLDGLKEAVNAIQYASKVEGREDSAQLRRERLFQPGLDGHDQRVDMLRGRDWLEWGEHVAQMKREGYLECALALVHEMMGTTRGSAFWEHTPPPGWYNEAAVILRKLKDYDAEVRILGEALEGYPDSESFSTRLQKARALQLKV
jgi:hypothetical protein